MKRSLTVFAFTGLVLGANVALADSNVDTDPVLEAPPGSGVGSARPARSGAGSKR